MKKFCPTGNVHTISRRSPGGRAACKENKKNMEGVISRGSKKYVAGCVLLGFLIFAVFISPGTQAQQSGDRRLGDQPGGGGFFGNIGGNLLGIGSSLLGGLFGGGGGGCSLDFGSIFGMFGSENPPASEGTPTGGNQGGDQRSGDQPAGSFDSPSLPSPPTGAFNTIFPSPQINAFSFFIPHSAYASVPVHETARGKEGCPDIEAWFFAKLLMRQLVGDIIDWVKTGGYDDRPLYVQDFRGYLIEAEDRGKAIFLKELNNDIAEFIGEPYRDFILTRFNTRVNKNIIPHAIYTATIEDPQAFYNDFAQGGFEAYMQTILSPANNPWGAILLEEDRLAAQEATESASTYLETLASEGFLPDKGKCLAYEDFGAGPICVEFGKIKFPGSNVQDILNEVFETDLTSLEGSDEIVEIIAQFLSRLILGGVLDFDTSDESLDPTPGGGGGGANGSISVSTSCMDRSGVSTPQNTISWSPPPGGPVIRPSQVKFCTGSNCLVTVGQPIACESAATSCAHTNLQPNTTYGYQVYTDNGLQAGHRSAYTDKGYITTGDCSGGGGSPLPPPGPILPGGF